MNPEQEKEHNEFIKESVANGSYFQDALDWYIFRYINPICERTILFFIMIIAIFINYSLFTTIKDSLPMVQEVPIIVKAKDQSLHFSSIKKLNDSEELRTIDEAIAKYLLTKYLKEREEFDFRKSNIEDLNKKFNIVKNNSSASEYKNFQLLMNKNNPNSPIRHFGKNVTRIVKIESLTFKRLKVDNFINKAKDFISVEIPTEAEIRYKTILNSAGKTTSQKYLTRVLFKFSGITEGNRNKLKEKLDFLVTSYKTYKIK